MAFSTLVLSLSSFVLVHGYTPTFRNEPTHPLKAPTESTLGLQVNDGTAAQTKSNEPAKHETVFSGGNHFEYLLLNDSNILLTSLQNDGPFDTAAAQFASTKQKPPRKNDRTPLNATTDSSKSIQIEATLPPHNVTAQNESNITVRIISKTNFKVEQPVESSRPINSGGGKSSLVLQDPGHQSLGSQNASFDRRPLKTTQFLVDPITKTEPDDYDDAFTKLLISNGILKPSKSRLIPYQKRNFNIDEVVALLKNNQSASTDDFASGEIVSTNIKTFENTSASTIENPKYVGTTLRTIPRQPDRHTKFFNKTEFNPTLQSSSNNGNAMNSNFERTFASQPETYNGNSSATILQNTNASTDRTAFSPNIQEEYPAILVIPNESSPHNTASQNLSDPLKTISNNEPISEVGKVLHKSDAVAQFREFENTSLGRNEFINIAVTSSTSDNLSRGADNNSGSKAKKFEHGYADDLELTLKNQAEMFNRDLFPASINTNSDSAPEAASLKMPPSRSMLNDSDWTKNDDDRTEDRQLTIPEFEDVLKLFVQNHFGPLIDYVVRLNKLNCSDKDATKANIYIRRFVLFNAKDIVLKYVLVKTKFGPGFSLQGPATIDTPLSRISPWTNLLDNSTVQVIRYVNKLFDGDGGDSDFLWFGVPLNETGPAPDPMFMKRDFHVFFETNLAVKMYLEYRGQKIEAVLALPRTLLPNISLSAPKLSVDVNIHASVNLNRSEMVELLCSNVTVFKYNSQSYHILGLGISRDTLRFNITTSQFEMDMLIYQNSVMAITFCVFLCLVFLGSRVLLFEYRLSVHPFINKYRFLGRSKKDRRQPQRDSLNVIFSENFDRENVNRSWLMINTQKNYMLRSCEEMPEKTSVQFPRRDRVDAEVMSLSDVVAVDSPRLNKENKVPMMGYQSYCVLLPHGRPHDGEERSFENPNYNQYSR